MAVKSNFASGDVLTASDVNSFLTNGGLVYITESSFTASASMPVSNCFSSSYAMYRIIYNSTSTANSNMNFRFRTGTTDDTSASYVQVGIGRYTLPGDAAYSSTALTAGFVGGVSRAHSVIDVHIGGTSGQDYPRLVYSAAFYDGYWYIRTGSVFIDKTAQAYTGFTLLTSSGTASGNIRVYGYRQA